MLVYQGWYALIVLGTLTIEVEFSKEGWGDIETFMQIFVFILNPNNNQVNFVDVSIIIS